MPSRVLAFLDENGQMHVFSARTAAEVVAALTECVRIDRKEQALIRSGGLEYLHRLGDTLPDNFESVWSEVVAPFEIPGFGRSYGGRLYLTEIKKAP